MGTGAGFAVLGPLLVTRDGVPVDIGNAHKPRLLLAILLAHQGRAVRADTLVAGLWPGEVPASARSNLHQYVHRLRGMLGAGLIVARPGGYAATPAAQMLDAAHFDRLTASGSAATDPEQAARLFREALDLWRGNAYAEFADTDLIAPEAARLDQAHLMVHRLWAEAELAAGSPGAIVAPLTALIRQHPFDEGIAALLMRALAMTGRQAEALHVFRSIRRHLADQLGIEPAGPLQAVHQAILNGAPPPAVLSHTTALPGDARAAALPGDARAAAPSDSSASQSAAGQRAAPAGQGPAQSAAGQSSALHVPRQLPADVSRFVGRQEELATLREWAAAPVSAICGPGGAGKSALAVRAAHCLAASFPDGQLYLDLAGAGPGGALDPLAGLSRWLRALGIDARRVPTETAEAAAMFRELTAERRMLMVLDNASDTGQVRPLLPAGKGCHTIITSRTTLSTLDNARHLHLDVLSAAQSRELLAAFEPRAARETEAVEAILGYCGGLPLALRIAAAKLATRPDWTPEELARRLADERSRLDELRVQDLGVRAGIAVSLHGLEGDPAASLLDHLGLLPGNNFTLEAAAALVDRPVALTRVALERLVEAQLVRPGGSDRYLMHDLIRLFAWERAQTGLGGEREPARHRLLEHYRVRAVTAARLVFPDSPRVPRIGVTSPDLPSAQAALAWVEAELANVISLAGSAPDSAQTAELVHAINMILFNVLFRWPELCALSERWLEIASRQGDRFQEGRARESLALALCAVGRPAEAADHANAAVALCGSDGEAYDMRGAVLAVTFTYAHLERHDLLADRLESALALCREGGHTYAAATALAGLGRAYQHLDRLEESMTCHKESLDLGLEVHDGFTVAVATSNLGWTMLRAGDTVAALEQFEQAHRLARDVPHPLVRITAQWGIASARYAVGDVPAARELWAEAMTALAALDVLRPGEQDCLPAEGAPHPPWIIRAMI